MKKSLLACTLLSLVALKAEGNPVVELILGIGLLGGGAYTAQRAHEEYKRAQRLPNTAYFGGKKLLNNLDHKANNKLDNLFDYPRSKEEQRKRKRRQELEQLLDKAQLHFEHYKKVYGWSICSLLLFNIGLKYLVRSIS